MHPAGRKAPNDLGLFDMLGNAYEWCTDPYRAYPPATYSRVTIDGIMDAEFSDDVDRVLHCGAFVITASFLLAAIRARGRPASRDTIVGFRPARTYP